MLERYPSFREKAITRKRSSQLPYATYEPPSPRRLIFRGVFLATKPPCIAMTCSVSRVRLAKTSRNWRDRNIILDDRSYEISTYQKQLMKQNELRLNNFGMKK